MGSSNVGADRICSPRPFALRSDRCSARHEEPQRVGSCRRSQRPAVARFGPLGGLWIPRANSCPYARSGVLSEGVQLLAVSGLLSRDSPGFGRTRPWCGNDLTKQGYRRIQDVAPDGDPSHGSTSFQSHARLRASKDRRGCAVGRWRAADASSGALWQVDVRPGLGEPSAGRLAPARRRC